MKIAIVTGVSKGLGKSTAEFLLESGIHVYGVSRNPNHQLQQLAEVNDVTFTHFSCDLGNAEQTNKLIAEIKEKLTEHKLSQMYLVNNAAVLSPINQATQTEAKELEYHFQVNIVTPMVLLNALLRFCDENIPFVGVNITSGAANRPIFGWSAYCSSKASLNMYTKAVALEQEELKTGNKIFAFSPGVMDTEMQAKIRSSSYDQFIDVDTFKNYKKQNLLSDTEAVAGVLVNILTDEVNIQNGKIYNVSEYF